MTGKKRPICLCLRYNIIERWSFEKITTLVPKAKGIYTSFGHAPSPVHLAHFDKTDTPGSGLAGNPLGI